MSVYQRDNGPPAFVVSPRVDVLAGRRLSFNRALAQNDSNPEGAIVDGLVKVQERDGRH